MKKNTIWWIPVLLLALLLWWLWQSNCTGKGRAPIVYHDSTLFFLREMDGKQWTELKLSSHPDLYKRMSKLVGTDWNQFQSEWVINHPVVVYDDILLLRGCNPQDCYASNFIFLADVHKNNLHIGIRNGTKIIERSEDSTYVPTAIHAWKIRKLE